MPQQMLRLDLKTSLATRPIRTGATTAQALWSAARLAVWVKFNEIAAHGQQISASTLLAGRVYLKGPAGGGQSGTGRPTAQSIALASGLKVELRPGSAGLVFVRLEAATAD